MPRTKRPTRPSVQKRAILGRSDPGNPTKLLTPISQPEIVFGLVAPIGTNLKMVETTLEKELKSVGYNCEIIHVSDLLKSLDYDFKIKERPVEERYTSYMNAGNELRKIFSRQDAFALMAAAAIRNRRGEITSSPPANGTAYILNQFKRPEEISTLRRIYGKAFIQISAYCSREKRLDELTSRISKSHYREKRKEFYRGRAADLIARDDDEQENNFGQRVNDTFPLADVIISAETEATIDQTISRFIRSFFGDNFVTPNIDEYGSFIAKTISYRSADLSRQVGAAVLADTGEIIATGCNEVPKSGGGTYWEGDPHDARDFVLGYDSSVTVKKEILEDIFRRLKDTWLSEDRSNKDIEELVSESLLSENPIMKDSLLMDVLEFGRMIHAEMGAISDAARTGRAVSGQTLYCTTFPCHICARHIVASGITRVVYLEPYSKSLAADLYPDSIQVGDNDHTDPPRVKFEQFVGIAPQRFAEIFAKGRRKDSQGNALRWSASNAVPMLEILVPSYLQNETAVVTALATLEAELRRRKTRPKTKQRTWKPALRKNVTR